MAVSVVTFKTGDRVITELKEIFDEEGEHKKGVCLLMEEPYVLTLDVAHHNILLNKLVWNIR